MDPILTPLMIILGKYALDKGVDLGKEVGPKALDTAKEMFTATLDYLRQKGAEGEVVANGFEKSPEVYEKPVEQKLEEALQADPDFAARLKVMLEQYEQAAKEHAAATGTSYQAIVTDSTAAIGSGAMAASGRSVAVGGNVEGGIRIDHGDKDD